MRNLVLKTLRISVSNIFLNALNIYEYPLLLIGYYKIKFLS